jgi:hypothetical protein
MAVDYNAGTSSAIAQQYADLRLALASEGEAKNKQKAREIERKGLFGSGIRQSDISDFAGIAMKGAEFGEKRMGRKMDRATKSFDRRQAADERRLTSLQKRADLGDADALTELKGIQSGMTERRNSFEDFMGKYQEKGLWGTSFGGKDVGYRTEGESKYSQAMRPKPGSGPGDTPEGGDVGGGLEGDRIDRYSSYPHQREFENIASGPGGGGGEPTAQSSPGQSELEDKFGRGPIGAPKQSSYGRSEFEDKHGREWGQYDPDLAGRGGDVLKGGGKSYEGTGQRPDGGSSGGSAMGSGVGPGASGGGRTEQRIPEAYLRDEIAPSSNKFEEGMMNTGRSGPVQNNAPFETFKDAFRNARRQKGAGATFDWRGNPYTTDYK